MSTRPFQHHKRRDDNERELCEAVRAIPGRDISIQTIEGATTHKGQRLPKGGTPDLLVGFEGRTFLAEVKNVTKHTARLSRTPLYKLRSTFSAALERLGEPVARLLSPAQHEWMRDWRGAPPVVVTSAQELAAVLGVCLRCGIYCTGGQCDYCVSLQ